MVGDRDALFEEPTRRLDVAALGECTRIDAYPALQQLHGRCGLSREPSHPVDSLAPRDQRGRRFDHRLGNTGDRFARAEGDGDAGLARNYVNERSLHFVKRGVDANGDGFGVMTISLEVLLRAETSSIDCLRAGGTPPLVSLLE